MNAVALAALWCVPVGPGTWWLPNADASPREKIVVVEVDGAWCRLEQRTLEVRSVGDVRLRTYDLSRYYRNLGWPAARADGWLNRRTVWQSIAFSWQYAPKGRETQ